MKKYSYCVMHDTYPADDEPCWACINRFVRYFNLPEDVAIEYLQTKDQITLAEDDNG